MSNTVTTQTLVDTQHRAVIKFTCLSDGTAESLLTKVDLTDLKYYVSGCSVTITQAQWVVSGNKSVRIVWGGDTPADALLVSQSGHLVFNGVLGTPIENNATGPTAADHIQFSTVGFASGDVYSIILELKKKGFDGWKNNQILIPRTYMAVDPSSSTDVSSTFDVDTLTLTATAVAPTINSTVSKFVPPLTLDVTFTNPSFILAADSTVAATVTIVDPTVTGDSQSAPDVNELTGTIVDPTVTTE